MIKLAISGCKGRMGQAIFKSALDQKELFAVTALLEHKDHPDLHSLIHDIKVSSDPQSLKESDVLIDFTLPDGTISKLESCIAHGVKMVIGTTGLTPAQVQKIETASKKIPIVFASNMSIGVNILFKLIEIAGSQLKGSIVKISETHHVHKKDSPSGTAKTMRNIVESASGHPISGVDSKREGEVVGFHEIIFDTPEDTLKISHNAKDRAMFAKGALKAAQFLMDKDKGLFSMQDVLGLN